MDFEETEEQGMIREMVRDFAEEVLAPTCLERDRAQKPPIEEWATFCEYGLQGSSQGGEDSGEPEKREAQLNISSHYQPFKSIIDLFFVLSQ